MIRCGKYLNKEVDLGESTFFLDHACLVCTQRQCQKSKDVVADHVRIANFSRGSREIAIPSKIFVFLHGLLIWLVMQRNVWSDIVS